MAISALRFLYKVSLKKDWTFEDIIPAPKKPQKLYDFLGTEDHGRSGLRFSIG